MTSVLRHHRYGRALGAGAMTVALLSGGTAGAFAATSTPSPKATMSAGMPTKKPMPTHMATGKPMPTRTATAMGSITVSTAHKTVRHGETVAFAGRVKGIKSGATLVLQHRTKGKWTTLRSMTTVNRNGTFTIRRAFTAKGTETVRVATKDGRIMSSPLTVKVS
ncbi:hypothetical protein Shyhy01_15580 [Streptomyces hygroscopicus subsp. hygroscopicus]|uniref:hypothetical protein n=1 Tax=Streptomyces sp. KHY 26 TaxID=3097359 RepID=UPI0024A3E5B5|nr:hypothetical protein [Streptomyces hygroscopicus]GLX48608.1 hypothetical protein Shyhy01_15580 [Streptomyces hygroscopicus subsp. hygroscopicus]